MFLACFLIRSQSCNGFSRVVAVLCLSLGKANCEKKWVGSTSLCFVIFMLYQNRGAGRHHANLLRLPTWQMGFFSNNYLIWRKQNLRFEGIFFLSLSLRSLTSCTQSLICVVSPSKRTRKQQTKTSGCKFKNKRHLLFIHNVVALCKSTQSDTVDSTHLMRA